MKNKVFAIFFILVLFAPGTGTYLWLLSRKEVVRQQLDEKISTGIDSDRLVFIAETHGPGPEAQQG